MATFDTEVDVDDMLFGMSRFEKQEMADALYDDGYVPSQMEKDLEGDSRTPTTNLEIELSDMLDRVWRNRMCLSEDDKQTLKCLATKGLYD